MAIGDGALFNNGVNVTIPAFQAVSNTAVGSQSLYGNTTGSSNTATGFNTLYSNDGGSYNAAFGWKALYTNTFGADNTAAGSRSLLSNKTGSNNTALGSSSLTLNRSAGGNTAVGVYSLFSDTTGSNNTAVGYFALENNENGASNVAIGYNALNNSTNSSNTVAIGDGALFNNGVNVTIPATQALNNTAVGSQALYNNTIGSNNTAIGYHADVASGGLTNATAIGYNAIAGANNSMVLGGIGTGAVNVGIGVSIPIVTLQVKGTENIFSGANTHTGNFYNGTSNVDGIEMVSGGSDAYVGLQRASGFPIHISKPNVISNNGLVGFLINNTLVGSITTTGSTTAYNTTSDARLKENIISTNYGLGTLMKINVVDYHFSAGDKKDLQTGFLAQELYSIYPQAVHIGGTDVKTDPWMIDYSRLTPLLVKAVQEQQSQMNDLEKQLTELKTENSELRSLSKKTEDLARELSELKNEIHKH